MSTVSYYTAEGLKKLRDELDQLKSIERPKASQAIAEARDKGDLSENAEYDGKAQPAQNRVTLEKEIQYNNDGEVDRSQFENPSDVPLQDTQPAPSSRERSSNSNSLTAAARLLSSMS